MSTQQVRIMSTEQAEQHEFTSIDEAVEYCYSQGWSDGLPFLLPTPERVAKLIEASGMDAGDRVGVIPPKNGVATVEKVAINCAMAGLLPELFPVVLTALQAMLDPSFNLNGVQATTHPCAPLVIVSGPAVREFGFNSKDGVFGGGSRVNVSVGRAVRMVLWNIGGAVPGDIDKSTFGSPAKFAFCIAEDPDDNPWEPLHVSRLPGSSPDDSAVTVFACEPNHNIADTQNDTPQALLRLIGDCMATMGNTNARWGGNVLLVLGPERARVMKSAGWSREDVTRYLWQYCRRPRKDFVTFRMPHPIPRWSGVRHDDDLQAVFDSPEDIVVTVAGGSGPHSAICPGWGTHGGYAITRLIGKGAAETR
jgi:hypothetical protein